MSKSHEYRARAEDCRTRAATSFSPEAWLKLASNWLALIPQQTEAASQQLKAVEHEGGTGQEGSEREH
jgi:hypothetical protein